MAGCSLWAGIEVAAVAITGGVCGFAPDQGSDDELR